MTVNKSIFAFTVAIALSACSTHDRSRQGNVATEGATAITEIAGPNDAEIVHILQTANKSEVQAAELARKKSKNKEVLSFASHMIKDHGAMATELNGIGKAVGTSGEKNAISMSLAVGSAATMSSLRDLRGAKFDRAYLDNQEQMHKQVLETIDQNLLPNAKDENLRASLVKARASVAQHMEHAAQLIDKIAQ